jgi:flagellar basal-body rod protein FlgB
MAFSLFENSTLPVLEQVVNFTEARHGVLAGNIANLDTPGYRTRDLSPDLFQERLHEAIERRRESRAPRSPYPVPTSTQVQSTTRSGENEWAESSTKGILRHDENNTSLEHQVTEIAKNNAQHNLALSLMSAQFRLLRAAITERA